MYIYIYIYTVLCVFSIRLAKVAIRVPDLEVTGMLFIPHDYIYTHQ